MPELIVTEINKVTVVTEVKAVPTVVDVQPLPAPTVEVRANGPSGPRGQGVYEVWLAEGNVGTVADFLESIKGEQGDPGNPGADLTISAATKGVVIHGANANIARPATYGSVDWIGSVAPVNMGANDMWIDTTL